MMELPESWAVEPFSDVARYATGRTPARANPGYWAKGVNLVPWVAISDMEEYGILTETAEFVSEAAFKDVFRERIVPAGTLLMSFKLTIGRVATLGVPACHNEAIISIYPRQGVDQRYLGYFLSQVDYTDHQDRQIKGNTLNQSKIDQIQVALPPSDEQARIADVLDKCRLGIDTERTAEATAQELKRAVMRELFTRGLRGEGQKETEIGLVPESWTPTPIVQLGEVKGGKRMPKGVSLVQEDTGRPYIRVTDLRDHGVRESGILFVPKGYEDVIRRYRISSRDVYISIAGSIGLVGQVPESLNEANLTENAAKIVVERGDVLPRFLMYALASATCQDQIERATAKNAQPKLALTRIEQILVPFPAILDEQREISAVLDALDRKIALHRQKHAALEELFQSLLHKLMTGEIRVADLDLSALKQASEVAA